MSGDALRAVVALAAIGAAVALAAFDHSNVAVAVAIVTGVVGHVLGEQTGSQRTARALKVIQADDAVGQLVDERVRRITEANRGAISALRNVPDPPKG